MDAPPQPLPRRGKFIGSGGTKFRDQVASDIHFEDYFAFLPHGEVKSRVCHACAAWGVGLVFVETKDQHGPWDYWPIGHQQLLVQDRGEAREGPGLGGLPLLPAPGLGQYAINQTAIIGYRILWNHTVDVRRSKVGETLHYHKYEERMDHRPDRLNIRPQGSGHYEFMTLSYGSQVQNYRRIKPL